ncbi:hypothetical protein JCM4814A_66920 [Streptomyces phaeofaciens JCM 4814]|uniref:DUF5753 domain-containing protein n=1 Tax=Streptomyces phaeofaciens TaxID=68254 RepID=A0A918LR32_9ACTN|nr:hypothetical protein GCM10010226_15570 [Streptomyces phaeofaciens]
MPGENGAKRDTGDACGPWVMGHAPPQLERYRLILDRTTQAALPAAKSRDFIAQLTQDL